jgi:hypothetical protein
MPLPDANKRSPRVYTNLQNIDLDTVSFAQVQSTGNPIAVEELNEDEMRRLVLVNLARLVVAGEWTGLLEAGGGTQYAFEPVDASLLPATYAKFSPVDIYRLQSTTVSVSDLEDVALFIRFVAPKDGTIGNMTVRTGQTNTAKDDVKIGVYSSSGGLPTDRIGDIDIDVNGGADLYTSSSWSTAPPIVAGTTYWIGFVSGGAANPSVSMASTTQFLALGLTHYPGTAYNTLFNNTGTDYDMPSTVDLDLTTPKNSYAFPVFMYQYA